MGKVKNRKKGKLGKSAKNIVPEDEQREISKIKTPQVHKSVRLFKFDRKTKEIDGVKHKTLRLKFTLHKVPPKFIKLQVLEDRYSLDTLESRMKYQIQESYPHDIKLDLAKWEEWKDSERAVEYKHGILTVTLPIATISKEESQNQLKIISAVQQEMKKKFPAVQSKKSVIERFKKDMINREKKSKKNKNFHMEQIQQILAKSKQKKKSKQKN